MQFLRHTLILNILYRTHIESVETAKLRFYSPSKLDLAHHNRRFRNSNSFGDGYQNPSVPRCMQAHLPETIGFKLLQSAYPPFLSVYFSRPLRPHFLTSSFVLHFFSLIISFYNRSSSSFSVPLHPPALFAVMANPFLLPRFYHRIFRSQFVGRQIQPRRRTRKEAHFALGKQRRKTIIARLTITI